VPCKRYLIVCEGQSERAYLQRLQSFIDNQPVVEGAFEPPLQFIAPYRLVAKSGACDKLISLYKKTKKENKNSSIEIWADFDLYHRNDNQCVNHYFKKSPNIPDFRFSFHNFEDFYALHFNDIHLHEWINFGSSNGRNHFQSPLHDKGYMPEIKRIFPDYKKGELPAEFVSWSSLRNLKANLSHIPSVNPHNLSIQNFASFLIHEIENAYPSQL